MKNILNQNHGIIIKQLYHLYTLYEYTGVYFHFYKDDVIIRSIIIYNAQYVNLFICLVICCCLVSISGM